MQEELDEFKKASLEADLHEMADALADLIWTACGTAHYCGVPLDLVWDEVKRANLEKVRLVRGADQTQKNWRVDVITKPAGWRPPDHRRALGLDK